MRTERMAVTPSEILRFVIRRISERFKMLVAYLPREAPFLLVVVGFLAVVLIAVYIYAGATWEG